jgi:hypothetical protein
MADIFQIKRRDTSPALLYRISPAPSSLAGASIIFNLKNASGTVVINRAAADNTDSDILRYQWQAGDTDTVGQFQGEFEITYADGTVGTWPNRGFIPVVIYDDIA